MKFVRLLMAGSILASVVAGCSKNADPSGSTALSLKMSAGSVNGKTAMGARMAASGMRVDAKDTVILADVKVNVQNIKFDFDRDDDHFKKDSAFDEGKDRRLKGPFIVDLMKDSAFVSEVIMKIAIPNAKYEKVRFKLAPSEATGDMEEKSILIKGTIGTKPFVFWDNARLSFSAKFPDSTALATSVAAVTLAINLELDKIMEVANRGFLSQAKDGNNDGTITIDRHNDDGNGEVAEKLIWLLEHHAIHWEREREDH
jgi:hypothetical protein